MMRTRFDTQLKELHAELILMSALCEDAISGAISALFNTDKEIVEKVNKIEVKINEKEAQIENLCKNLIIHEQPVASDYRNISVAQKMIVDMERIGDQAQDIAELSLYCTTDPQSLPMIDELPLKEMAAASQKMLKDSIDSFIKSDKALAQAVIDGDDMVDELLGITKRSLVGKIKEASGNEELCLDLLMIAKYFERIGDHSENIAQHAIYSITGEYAKK